MREEHPSLVGPQSSLQLLVCNLCFAFAPPVCFRCRRGSGRSRRFAGCLRTRYTWRQSARAFASPPLSPTQRTCRTFPREPGKGRCRAGGEALKQDPCGESEPLSEAANLLPSILMTRIQSARVSGSQCGAKLIGLLSHGSDAQMTLFNLANK